MTDVFISYKREDEAKVARLAEDAELLCAVSDSELERLAGVTAAPVRFDCREVAAGWTCAADDRATCALERRGSVEHCPDGDG